MTCGNVICQIKTKKHDQQEAIKQYEENMKEIINDPNAP